MNRRRPRTLLSLELRFLPVPCPMSELLERRLDDPPAASLAENVGSSSGARVTLPRRATAGCVTAADCDCGCGTCGTCGEERDTCESLALRLPTALTPSDVDRWP